MTRLYVVEDHPIMRQTLCAFLKRQPGVTLCGDAGSAEAALAQIDEAKPEIMLIDMAMARMSGLELLTLLQEIHPSILCVVLSGHAERRYVERAMLLGARAYILKGETDELVVALQRVMDGQIYVSKAVADIMASLAVRKLAVLVTLQKCIPAP